MYESEIIGIVFASISPPSRRTTCGGERVLPNGRTWVRPDGISEITISPEFRPIWGITTCGSPRRRQAQADMAREYGVEGFVYWHYWFGNGKRLLERPFNEVLASGEPDFPFALAWANESWRGFAHGITNRNMLIEQLYGGVEDYTAHFRAVLPAFRDHRYITVDGKPLFMIYKPLADPEVKVFIATWRELAEKNGLPGIYFVGHENAPVPNVGAIFSTGVDAVNPLRLVGYFNVRHSFFERQRVKFDRWRKIPLNYPYERMAAYFLNGDEDTRENVFPSVIPNWDHTPCSGKQGWIVTDSTPELFGKHLREAVEMVRGKAPEHRIILLKSWNEWAEGNYVEPDLKWGRGYLEAIRREVMDE